MCISCSDLLQVQSLGVSQWYPKNVNCARRSTQAAELYRLTENVPTQKEENDEGCTAKMF